MAATDKTFRNQKTLNIVFSVSCVLMLFSILWMVERDYNKAFKSEQRTFRRAEELIFMRSLLTQLPSEEAVLKASEAVAQAKKALEEARAATDYESKRKELAAIHEKAKTTMQALKADFDANMSYRNIAAEEHGEESSEVARYDAMLKPSQDGSSLYDRWQAAQTELVKVEARMENELVAPYRKELDALSAAQDRLKRLTSEMDRIAKVVTEKGWGAAQTALNLPIIDALAPTTRVHQIYLPELTIDYGGFKRVPRFDRCTTCHLGIDRSIFDRESLMDLNYGANNTLKGNLEKAHEIFRKRKENGEELPFDLSKLPKEYGSLSLTPAQITEFAVHPRLDLFVGSNSPHPKEKFGCTVCHRGQGSATSFNLASHSPNTALQHRQWSEASEEDGGHHFHANHYWDFPMLPNRFTESSCLQCHHQVTDLISEGKKEEAPKLLEGYRLIRKNGCFGCHNISRIKEEKVVGPDMRAELSPALEWLPAEEQAALLADEQNMPGTYRRVGPSLRRLAEKTNETWLRKWLASPRGFRPGTTMPHFYDLSTNSKEYLSKHAAEQKNFPDAEIYAIARYLQFESEQFLRGNDTTRRLLEKEMNDLQNKLTAGEMGAKDRKLLGQVVIRLRDLSLLSVPAKSEAINASVTRLQNLHDERYVLQGKIDESPGSAHSTLKKAIDEETKKFFELGSAQPIKDDVRDSQGTPVDVAALLKVKSDDATLKQGRQLFSEKGCLACHSHMGVMEGGSRDAPNLANADAEFGPDLSRLTAKLGQAGDEDSARRWLIQWLLNPNLHNPRTYMPVTHLTPEEANLIALWLQAQKGPEWDQKDVPRPSNATIEELARPHLLASASIGRLNIDKILKEGLTEEYLKSLSRKKELKFDADERILLPQGPLTLQDRLLLFVGKKAIGRLGCFGCHDLPGFEGAKPIGTPLNDWGQKDPARIAFEDSVAYAKTHLNIVDLVMDPQLVDLIKTIATETDAETLQTKIQNVELLMKNDRVKQAMVGELAKVALAKMKPTNREARLRFEEWRNRYASRVKQKEMEDYFAKKKNEKRPMERYFFTALKEHQREGFLALKLMQPRSYDYSRLRAWEDRLRMPQFRFKRTRRRPKESLEAYKKRYVAESNGEYDQRTQAEEAQAREAVMTFVLGLVADPVPKKYVAKPKDERKDIVEGREVLEKFNCASCHQISPGSYEVDIGNEGKRQAVLESLRESLNSVSRAEDHVFHSSNAWIGDLIGSHKIKLDAVYPTNRNPVQLPTSDGPIGMYVDEEVEDDDASKRYRSMLKSRQLTLHEAIHRPESRNYTVELRLSSAIRFTDATGKEQNLPAGQSVRLPLSAFNVDASASPWGGDFPQLLMPYLRSRGKGPQGDWGKAEDAYTSTPPPLLREGERVRPDWLYQFLLNPTMVRPATVLRMPRFNLSDADARKLVKYFAAVAKTRNERLGLTGQFVAEPQRKAEYWAQKTEQYLKRFSKEEKEAKIKELTPLWKMAVTDEAARKEQIVKTMDATIKYLEEQLKKPKDQIPEGTQTAYDNAKAALEAAKKQLATLKKQLADNDFKEYQTDWETRQAYSADAFRMVTDRASACMGCHSVGNIVQAGLKGPDLLLAAQRLRPKWTGQWIAHPKRMLAYNPQMFMVFPGDKEAAGILSVFKDPPQLEKLNQEKAAVQAKLKPLQEQLNKLKEMKEQTEAVKSEIEQTQKKIDKVQQDLIQVERRRLPVLQAAQRDRALAARDILMRLPEIAEQAINRYYPLAPKGGN